MADYDMEEDISTVDVEEEEEEEISIEDDDDHEDEQVKELIPSSTPRVSSSINDPNEGDEKKEIDVCSICFEAWTSGGNHRICCLPCGHVYGKSCIRKWLLWCQGDGKCPKCKSLCTLKDIIVLYSTRLCVADEVSCKASTTNFPYTKEGFSGFQEHVSSCLDALRQRIDVLERSIEECRSQLHFLQQGYGELVGRDQENSQ